ncbi:signal peptide peptidase SppA [bacterium]|nr:signal peptide peptidase SppA [bacterium]
MSNRSGFSRFFIVIFLLGIVIELGMIVAILKGDANPDGNIAVVEVQGAIDGSMDTVKLLKKYEEKKEVKAIVLRVNSPGGVVGSSQEIHDEIKRINKGKKVVVSMGDVAASGGYYIAAPAEKIIANPGTITGSIGVIANYFIFGDALKKLNIRWELIKAGKNKDIGSPLRNLRPEERKIMQDMMDDMHDQFIEAIAQGRKLDKATVSNLADGRVYSGRQAKQVKLVDELGGLEYAIKAAAKLANIKEKDIQAIYPPKEDDSFFAKVFGKTFLSKLLTQDKQSQVEYRYVQ